MIKLINLNSSQMDQFIDFNKRVYPHRKDVKEHFNWWFLNNPLLKDRNNFEMLLCLKKNEEIIGQCLFNPVELYFNGKVSEFYWGTDYYVLPNHRGISGILLSMKVIKGEIPYIGIGPSDAVGKMQVSSGFKKIGSTRRFVRFRSPLAPLKLVKNIFLNKISSRKNDSNDDNDSNDNKFPQILFSHGVKFDLVDNLNVDLKDWKEYYWKNTWGFSRSLDFLKWRFFDCYQKYYFYLADVENKRGEKKQIYFVVRKGVWKGVTFLFLVDYKVPPGFVKGWKAILKASKILTRQSGCEGILTMSSHSFFEKELKKSFFITLGKENIIITNTKIDVIDKLVQDRNFVCATMADSDSEFSFWW